MWLKFSGLDGVMVATQGLQLTEIPSGMDCMVFGADTVASKSKGPVLVSHHNLAPSMQRSLDSVQYLLQVISRRHADSMQGSSAVFLLFFLVCAKMKLLYLLIVSLLVSGLAVAELVDSFDKCKEFFLTLKAEAETLSVCSDPSLVLGVAVWSHDYERSKDHGFQKGHLFPVHHAAPESMEATMTLTNAAPQAAALNQGQWKANEAHVAKVQAATFVMKITATDADIGENAEISYRILESSPMGDMFYINHETGEIFVKQDSLDREMHASYTLKVIGSDMNGKAGCRTGTGSVVINILDVNDNIPTLEKPNQCGVKNMLSGVLPLAGLGLGPPTSGYDSSVEENAINVEVIRIKVVDLDIEFINQLSVFTIVSENKAGYIRIMTDEKTNEGALDYEELKELDIKVEVRNKATYHSSVQSVGSTVYPIKIKVTNQLEGPKFKPAVKSFTISETSTIHTVIGTYAAINEDTGKTATNVRGRGHGQPISIAPYSGHIAFSGAAPISLNLPSKTATGTVVIQVEDENDHCPTLPSLSQEVCAYEDAVVVSAEDADPDPNGAPFEYLVIPDSTKLKWTVERINDTSVVLRSHENLWPGQYQLAVEVSDQQGKTCGPQVLDLMVQPCFLGIAGGPKSSSPSAVFGAPGVGFLLLALLLLLLVPLLLMYCTCGGKGPFVPQFPMEPGQHLIDYHTEGLGEDQLHQQYRAPGTLPAGVCLVVWGGLNPSLAILSAHSGTKGTLTVSSSSVILQCHRQCAISEALGIQEDELQMYDYEGGDSPAGSVGCCSDLGSNGDLSFLNDLDIKFKSLAEICQGSAIEHKGSHAVAPSSPPQLTITPLTTTADTSVSSLMTETHTKAVNSFVLRPPSPSSSPYHVNEMSHMISATSSLPRVHLTEMGDVASQAYLVYPAPAQVISGTHCVLEDRSAQMHHGPSLLVTDARVNQGFIRAESPRPGSHNLLVVERQVTKEDSFRPPQAFVQNISPTGSPNLLVTDAGVSQGFIRAEGPRPGSHNLLVVERQNISPTGSPNLLVTDAGVSQGFIRAEGPRPGSHNLLVVERKVTKEDSLGPPQAFVQNIRPTGSPNLLVTDAGVSQGFIRAEGPRPGSHNLLVVERQAFVQNINSTGSTNLLVTDAGVSHGFVRAESPRPGAHNLMVLENSQLLQSMVLQEKHISVSEKIFQQISTSAHHTPI
ncbi:hypothetical protein JZ751_010044 [Albula glossodonta]|uniref:Cadherin domain-containing protein n=1 Tax=Albula glossodonta TaxID=121402 RepID=A0A8T2NBE3_9TELE|nr:hypothetical protein JZ751_010044 [Albula glossodonta]